MKKNKYAQLLTRDTKVDDIPLSEYPRPQLKRNSYISLNGTWDFAISSSKDLPSNYYRNILVPFCVESYLSGINQTINRKDYLHYRKIFKLDSSFIKDKVLLHLDGIDTYASVYINNNLVAYHEGGYIPFEVDIKPYLQEVNSLQIVVNDPLDHKYPYGKQKVKRGGMWYTPCSGIWKSVWLESVSEDYIQNVKFEPTLHSIKISVVGGQTYKKYAIKASKNIISGFFEGDSTEIEIPNPINWSPENPHLYPIVIESGKDRIESYFALRTLKIDEYNNHKVFFLNDKPYFFHGLLDQGYFPDGNLTPRNYEEYERDILKAKIMGFNTLRKHIKIEPLYFYYLCDKIGMVVFQDMVNNMDYSFFKDTIVPTIGFKKLNDTKFKFPEEYKAIFISQMKESVSLLFSCPCICLWTIFNEGWGQFESKRVYDELIKLDTSRFIDETSGWFDNGNNIDSKHIYFKKVRMKYNDRVLYLSEFGGYEFTLEGHRYNPYKIFGYKHYKSKNKFQKGITSLYEKQIIPLIKKGLSASIYTQLTDVEDETNGLLTYDRKVTKVDKDEMYRISEKLKF